MIYMTLKNLVRSWQKCKKTHQWIKISKGYSSHRTCSRTHGWAVATCGLPHIHDNLPDFTEATHSGTENLKRLSVCLILADVHYARFPQSQSSPTIATSSILSMKGIQDRCQKEPLWCGEVLTCSLSEILLTPSSSPRPNFFFSLLWIVNFFSLACLRNSL